MGKRVRMVALALAVIITLYLFFGMMLDATTPNVPTLVNVVSAEMIQSGNVEHLFDMQVRGTTLAAWKFKTSEQVCVVLTSGYRGEIIFELECDKR